MNKIDDKIAEYEDCLRDAERDIEKALQVICPLRGDVLANVRQELNRALGLVQCNIRSSWLLYDSPDIELS